MEPAAEAATDVRRAGTQQQRLPSDVQHTRRIGRLLASQWVTGLGIFASGGFERGVRSMCGGSLSTQTRQLAWGSSKGCRRVEK